MLVLDTRDIVISVSMAFDRRNRFSNFAAPPSHVGQTLRYFKREIEFNYSWLADGMPRLGTTKEKAFFL